MNSLEEALRASLTTESKFCAQCGTAAGCEHTQSGETYQPPPPPPAPPGWRELGYGNPYERDDSPHKALTRTLKSNGWKKMFTPGQGISYNHDSIPGIVSVTKNGNGQSASWRHLDLAGKRAEGQHPAELDRHLKSLA